MSNLEARIKVLEEENAQKDEKIRRLSVGGAALTAAAPVEEKGLYDIGDWKMTGVRVEIAKGLVPSEEEKEEYSVYEDDPALGQPCPDLSSLKIFNGEAPVVGQGKPLVITFYSKLNKSDYATLSAISEYRQLYPEAQYLAISRDKGDQDVPKFLKKNQGVYNNTLTAPNGAKGMTIYVEYPIAYDAKEDVNKLFKALLKKATVGVGFTLIIDGQGKVVWHEQFNRGANPMGQFEEQLKRTIKGEALLSNGPTPAIVEVEVAALEGEVMEDPFGDINDNY